jgi:hypothetical protein
VQVSVEAFGELLRWLDGGGEIAIFDASNVSIQRRAKLMELTNNEMARTNTNIGARASPPLACPPLAAPLPVRRARVRYGNEGIVTVRA